MDVFSYWASKAKRTKKKKESPFFFFFCWAFSFCFILFYYVIVTYKHNFIYDIRVGNLCLFWLLHLFSFVNGCWLGRRQIFFFRKKKKKTKNRNVIFVLPSIFKCFIFIYRRSERKIKTSVLLSVC